MTQRELQSEVMRFADRFLVAIDDASRDLGKAVKTPQGRALAQRFKVDQISSAITIAAGPNPTVNLVDMVTLLTLQRSFLENYWLKDVYGESARPLLIAYNRLEEEIWALAKRILTSEQEQELRNIIEDWLKANPGSHSTSHIPFEEFAREAGRYPPIRRTKPGGLFGLVFLDPLARLDLTRQAIESSQYLAQRSMFYLQRMPKILQEQTLQSFLDIVKTPEIQSAQSQVERLTSTAETFTHAATLLPEQFRKERTAAVQQVLDGFGTERTNLLNHLLSKEQQLRGLLDTLQATLTSAQRSATSIDSAASSISQLIDRFETAKAQAKINRPTGGRPFDIRDYGSAAQDIGAGAEQLRHLVSSMQQNSAQMDQLLSQIQTRSNLWTTHFFNRALLCASLIVFQVLVACLVYRLISERMRHREKSPQS